MALDPKPYAPPVPRWGTCATTCEALAPGPWTLSPTHPPLPQVGDLRNYLCGYFDTTTGPKVAARSYREIQLHLGVDTAQVGGWGGARVQG